MQFRSYRWLLASLVFIFAQLGYAQATETTKTVVFVCQHGTAKSMVAAAHFNRLAQQQNLPYRAISRGITPEASLQAATKTGLEQDGIDTSALGIGQITPELAQQADRVVLISVDQAPAYLSQASRWQDIPAISKDYAAARDVTLGHLQDLLKQLKSQP